MSHKDPREEVRAVSARMRRPPAVKREGLSRCIPGETQLVLNFVEPVVQVPGRLAGDFRRFEFLLDLRLAFLQIGDLRVLRGRFWRFPLHGFTPSRGCLVAEGCDRGRRLERAAEIAVIFLGDLGGLEQQVAKPGLHGLFRLHAQGLALLFPFLIFGDCVHVVIRFYGW